MHKLDDGDCDADDNDSTADSDDNAFVESLHTLAITIVSLRLENFMSHVVLQTIFRCEVFLTLIAHCSDDNAFASVHLLTPSIPIVSQRLENGPVAICVPTYRLQVRIIKLASLSTPCFLLQLHAEENGEILKLKMEKS